MAYNHKQIESKWQKKWEEEGLYKTSEDEKKPKYYILDMFPYPSGAGLHVGHVESYTATDILSRYYRLKGYNVMHPQGWDAFGLPAENYAVKTGVHPRETTKKAISVFKNQINSLGFSYDWDREVNSSDADYYKWTQWFFLFLYKNGLAYKSKGKVNWCPKCQTVLANEQAENGKCERCETEVMQKDLEQWYFKISDFIEDQNYEGREVKGLLNGLNDIDWPESTKLAQKNWIGRSEGASVKFKVESKKLKVDLLEVFTTRPDTLFGCTYMVVSPEHKILKNLESKIENLEEIKNYQVMARKKTDLERTDLNKDKSGVEIKGLKAVNPVNNEEIPIFVADYVLASYGTGAIMAVPAHDERDFEFAKKYNLEIREVVQDKYAKEQAEHTCFSGEGIAVNSDWLNFLETKVAKEKITEWLKEKKLAKKEINYRLRDWLVSRQRYWGAPIPIIYCDKCGEVPVPEKDLPVILPEDVDFKPTGESPLKYSKEFCDVKCPKCGGEARREFDTMDTFVCSSWYYLRYSDPQNKDEFASSENLKKWLPVDIYMGGAEHSVLHLLYSRFFTKVFHKYGLVDFNEPFIKLRHQGIILAEDGTKMSKSKGNVVNPDDLVESDGADSLRMYEMFMGSIEDMKPWNTKGIAGVRRFLEKIWKLAMEGSHPFLFSKAEGAGESGVRPLGGKNNKITSLLHKTIKKVEEDIESFKFNTAISQMMILVNALEKEEKISEDLYEKLLIILSPFAPHITEELWENLGHKESIFKEVWPKYDPELIKDETINLIIQVNGKLRDTIEVKADILKEEAQEKALASEKIKKWTEDKELKKVIFVPGKLINIVLV